MQYFVYVGYTLLLFFRHSLSQEVVILGKIL